MILKYILCAVAAYLLGSISTGVLLSRRLFHDDVRKHGSGGTGATNMLRTYRLKAALLTFAGDAAKAALAVLLGRYLAGFEGGCVAAVFAIVGHMWPLYFGFRGGKGIACTVGAIAVLYPILLVPLVILWGVPVLCSRCISLGSIIAALGLTPAVALWCHGQAVELVFPAPCTDIKQQTDPPGSRQGGKMKIAVLGSGAWGTALAMLLQKNGHEVSLWSYCEEESNTLRERGENRMLPGVPLPKGLALTHREDIVAGCELVVFAPPSYAMRQTAQRVKPYLTPGTVLVTVAKGVEPESGLRMSEILAEELPGYAVAALSGPSHAEEVAREMPTGCVAACPEKAIAEWVQGIFMNPSFRVYSSTDITGVELCGAAKNIIALAAGMAEGMGCGDNAKALMMSRALVELSALIKAAGGQENTCFGLAGMGDMIVTCTSPHSRNHMAGVAIGRGEHVAGDLGERHAVVEGYYAAQSVTALAQKLGVHMPICECVYDILFNGKDPAAALTELMLRDKRSEF